MKKIVTVLFVAFLLYVAGRIFLANTGLVGI